MKQVLSIGARDLLEQPQHNLQSNGGRINHFHQTPLCIQSLRRAVTSKSWMRHKGRDLKYVSKQKHFQFCYQADKKMRWLQSHKSTHQLSFPPVKQQMPQHNKPRHGVCSQPPIPPHEIYRVNPTSFSASLISSPETCLLALKPSEEKMWAPCLQVSGALWKGTVSPLWFHSHSGGWNREMAGRLVKHMAGLQGTAVRHQVLMEHFLPLFHLLINVTRSLGPE